MIEYKAQVSSPLASGEAGLTVSDKGLSITTLFEAAEIPFAGINALTIADYIVTVKADDGDYVFSRMGSWVQPFYNALFDAYNKAVLRSLFIKGDPLLTAKGTYSFTERNAVGGGSAPIHVYDNNVTVLPPDLSARRVPLCFATGMDQGDFELTLRLDSGESYTYARLGYDSAPFTNAVGRQIRALREKTLAAVREIDPSADTAQASKIAAIMPQGAAAAIGRLAGIAPSFVAALESKIAAARSDGYYSALKQLCDPAGIYAGFRKKEAPAADQDVPDAEDAADPYLIWLIAPSPDGRYAAVEFAEADAATFIYKTYGDFDGFARQLNRALEAISFRRDVIRMTDEELRKPENADYLMAAKRTAALQFVRSGFTGRIIHSGADTWKRKLTEIWNA